MVVRPDEGLEARGAGADRHQGVPSVRTRYRVVLLQHELRAAGSGPRAGNRQAGRRAIQQDRQVEWARRAASARMSISTILPPLIVKPMTEKSSPLVTVTSPTAPLTSAGREKRATCETLTKTLGPYWESPPLLKRL